MKVGKTADSKNIQNVHCHLPRLDQGVERKGLKKCKVYNTLFPGNSYNANLGRTRLSIKTLLNCMRKKEKKRSTITYRKKHLTYNFKYREFCCLKKSKITT